MLMQKLVVQLDGFYVDVLWTGKGSYAGFHSIPTDVYNGRLAVTWGQAAQFTCTTKLQRENLQ